MLETAFLFFVDNICRDAARHVPTIDKNNRIPIVTDFVLYKGRFCSFRLGYG